jgi:enolase-phosphatase E1
MIRFAGRAILLDIEGTTSSIRFVYDVLFPFARERMEDFLRRCGHEPDVRDACLRIALEAGWTDYDAPRIVAEVHRLMDADIKATGLKALQGLIWEEGYSQGLLRSHVYPDVAPALAQWRERGLDVRIYSSGSIAAQKAFFRQTEAGDLLPLLRGHYDTTTGPKRESASYERIAADMALPADQILFLSDLPAELDAAAAAALTTGLVVRPGNARVEDGCRHVRINSLDQVSMKHFDQKDH